MVSQKQADEGAAKIGSYSQENTKTLLQYLYTALDKQVVNIRAEVSNFESHFAEALSEPLLKLFKEFAAPFNKFQPGNFDEKLALKAELSGLFLANERDSVALFTALLTNTGGRSFLVSYSLALLDAVINSNKRIVLLFRKNTAKSTPNLLDTLTTVFTCYKDDETIALLAAKTLSTVINTQYFRITVTQAEKFFNFFVERNLLNIDNEYFRDVLSCFQKVLVADYLRDVFVYRTKTHVILIGLLRKITLNDQKNVAGLLQAGLQYQLVFCLWLVSFNKDIANSLTENVGEKLASIVSDADVVGGVDFVTLLCDVVSLSERDKVHRICLATLVNLIKFTNPYRRRLVLITMVGLRFQDCLRQLERHQMNSGEEDSVNDDYRADFFSVLNFLNNGIDDLTNFEEYSAEVKSRRLTWSPAHKSERFWHENHMKLCENDYEILKILVGLLLSGEVGENVVDSETVAIACHDIGEFCRHYNRGKYAVEKLGGKMAIMGLLNHKDLAVRYEALIAMQKFLLQNWEFLGKQLHNTDTFRVLPNSESRAEI